MQNDISIQGILLFATAQTSISAHGISSSPNTIINIATLFRFFMLAPFKNEVDFAL